jgi:anti-anti-sigma factor
LALSVKQAAGLIGRGEFSGDADGNPGQGEPVVAADQLTTNLYRQGSTRTLFLTGELVVATASVLEGAVDGALDGQGGELCLDLGDLELMDSSGARAIMRAHDKAASLGSRLVVLSPAPLVRRVLVFMGLHRVMDIKDGTRPARRLSV